jgi:hypothetical protein
MPFVILPTNSASGGYEITNSLRFNEASDDKLTRNITGVNTTQLTLSFWTKRTSGASSDNYVLFTSENNSGQYLFIDFGTPYMGVQIGGTSNRRITNRVFRDHSAWYHIVITFDTTQATASDRIKIYINGVQETSFSTSTTGMSQNSNLPTISSTLNYAIGDYYGQTGFGYDGYLAEFYAIYGQALTPSSFGETDEDTGIWKPKAYTGTYGTNGFYLQFKNSSSLGTDSSGNGNNFTVNNLTSIDQTTDTPTNNFATMNPLTSYGTVTLAEGNLQVNVPNNTANSTSTFMVSSGKWYWEVKPTVGTLAMVGIRPEGMNYNQNSLFNLTGDYQGYYYYGDSGNIRPANTAYGNTFGVNDIIGVALDLDNNKLYFSKNGTFQNSGVPTSGATGTGAVSIATSGLTWGFSFTSGGNSDTIQCNFGNPPYSANSYQDANGFGNFSYSVPSGFYSLCTKNLSLYG